MRLMQTWCDAATAMTRANMATCEAINTQMTSLWTGAAAPPPAAPTPPAMWLDQWSAFTTPRFAPFMAFTPAAFAPPAPVMTNPWMTAGWGAPNPFGAMLASMTQAMMQPAVAFADAQPQQDSRDSRELQPMPVFGAAYRGAGGHAVAPSIKFSAEVPISTLASMASVWSWPWPTPRFA